MKHWLNRSLIVLVLLGALAGSALATLNIADMMHSIQAGRSNSVADRNAGVGQSQDLGSAGGKGFYMAIYQDTVKNPNKQAEEQIKQHFGIDFNIDLAPPKESGQFLFLRFFKDLKAYDETSYVPTLKDSLQSDCVRIKAAQVDDTARRLELVKKRMGERKQRLDDPKASPPTPGEVSREELLRLIGAFDKDSQDQLQTAVHAIPEYKDLTDQQVLFNCYEDLSSSVDFEMKLQSILNPSRKQLEALQTFVNGRLDDYASSFPKYDLLFDIDVIDYIFFGTPVATDVAKPDEISGESAGPGGYSSYQDLAKQSVNPTPSVRSSATGGAPTTPGATGTAVTAATATDPFAPTASNASSTEFGASSAAAAGPYCPLAPTGLHLDYSALNPPAAVAPAQHATTQEEALAQLSQQRGVEGAVARTTAVEPAATAATNPPAEAPVPSSLQEGPQNDGKNKKGLCEGTTGINFGNDLLKLIFCINIEFTKVGKTWETSRADDCIACHLYAINRIFEENVLKASVRPHKNAGTIMESSICEDGYGSAVGFQYSIEWVPVKFYKDICYPQGGVTSPDYAKLVGYPEIVARVNRPGFYVSCDADFKDADANKRCKEAIGGNELSYEDFKTSYLSSVDKRITSTDELKKDSDLWARLAGDQGIAQREVHLLSYKLGKDLPQYGEEEKIKPDFKIRLDYLNDTVHQIQMDQTLTVSSTQDLKVQQLLCLKGYGLRPQDKSRSACRDYKDTFRAFEHDVDLERDRVAKITNRWNTKSRDFGKDNACGVFSGSGPIDAFLKTFSGKTTPDYFLNSDTRETQTPEEQLTGQITANNDIDDVSRLLSKIDELVQFTVDAKNTQMQKQNFEGDQEKSLQLYGALAKEFSTFRSNLLAFTNWWADMVVNKQFVSKGGEKQNVLDNFFEKLK